MVYLSLKVSLFRFYVQTPFISSLLLPILLPPVMDKSRRIFKEGMEGIEKRGE
jgi:hypothetical protein